MKWIRGLSSDELVDYLPQLVVALRHETYEDSPLAEFLLDRSLRSPRVAHHLFWLLSHSLPGSSPQVSENALDYFLFRYFSVSVSNLVFVMCFQNCSLDVIRDVTLICEARHQRRITLILRALLAICGESLRKCFISQQLLVKVS